MFVVKLTLNYRQCTKVDIYTCPNVEQQKFSIISLLDCIILNEFNIKTKVVESKLMNKNMK